MPGPGARFITLDRTNLLRLVDTLEGAVPAAAADTEFRAGWMAAAESLRHIAIEMPHLYGDEGYPVPTTTRGD